MNEADLMRQVQVKLSALGARLFRNNIGRYRDGAGNYVQYGLANPGGSDLIGWTPIKITSDMVGLTLAQFTAIEVKSDVGRLSKHQIAFIEAVQISGGIAVCARSVSDAVGAVSGRQQD